MAKPSGFEEERGFQALLEKIEGEVKAFGEHVISLGKKMDQTATECHDGLAVLDGKVDLYFRTMADEFRALSMRLDAHERTHMSRGA